ncbi:hypothetical protein B4U79_16578 [Dinothrombium tinctorium]|uniref:Uncharacterized protein n=1 Tax=Dinothrombium tinctorium TaxID=1965070 RepID=A0A3S3P154_9ACAR|nr:hypothetical protein B4U79_16578 [Dinothrombium tinctorium]
MFETNSFSFLLILFIFQISHCDDRTKKEKRQIDQNSPLCTDGPTSVSILGVRNNENNDENRKDAFGTVLFDNRISVRIRRVTNETNIEISQLLQDAKDVESYILVITEQKILFQPKQKYFMKAISERSKNEYVFGGWNQVFLGCPQPLCIDATFDAMSAKSDNLLIFRGLFYWNLSQNAQPTVQNAHKTKTQFASVNNFVDAAAGDSLGDLILVDEFKKFHIFVKDLEATVNIFYPGLRSYTLGDDDVYTNFLKIFKKKLNYTAIPNSHFYKVDLIETIQLNQSVRSMFITKSVKLGQTNSWILVLFLENDQFIIVDLIRMARFYLRTHLNEFNRTIGLYLNSIDSPRSTWSNSFFGPFMIRGKLNVHFPYYPEAAFARDDKVYIIKSWKYYQFESSDFKPSNLAYFKQKQISEIGDVFLNILHCKVDNYAKWGFNSYDNFKEKFIKMLIKPQVIITTNPESSFQGILFSIFVVSIILISIGAFALHLKFKKRFEFSFCPQFLFENEIKSSSSKSAIEKSLTKSAVSKVNPSKSETKKVFAKQTKVT